MTLKFKYGSSELHTSAVDLNNKKEEIFSSEIFKKEALCIEIGMDMWICVIVTKFIGKQGVFENLSLLDKH